MSRIRQDSRKVVRTGTQYPATIVDTHGDRASARLSGNGAKLHNLSVIGGPVNVGETVQIDFTTPDPTIVAVAKEWLSIEDILRALDRLPKPMIEEPYNEWDKTICFCIDDPTEYYFLPGDYFGRWEAIDIIEADGNAHGYMRRWGVRLPPQDSSYHIPYQGSGGTHVPAYFWGDAMHPTVINVDDWYTCYGTYYENIVFDFWVDDTGSFINDGMMLVAWAYGSSWVGNPLRSPINDFLMLPDQLMNGYVFRNCIFNAGCGEYLSGGDTAQEYNHTCFEISPVLILDGYRSSDDIVVLENCHFKARDSYEPHLVQNTDEDYFPPSDQYRTKMYLYDCTVDCLDTPMNDNLQYVDVYSVGTRWIGVPNILSLHAHDILQTSDRATLDHVHGSSGSSGGNDPNAVHDNVSGEINMVSEKTQPVMEDVLLIEDSAASFAKKKVKFDNLPAPGTERFFLSGTITTGSGGGGVWVAPGYGEIENVYMHLKNTGSTSGSTGIDVNKNGTSIYSSNPKPIMAYDDADNKASSVPDANSFQAGDIFTFDIDSVAGGTPTDLSVIIAYNLIL